MHSYGCVYYRGLCLFIDMTVFPGSSRTETTQPLYPQYLIKYLAQREIHFPIGKIKRHLVNVYLTELTWRPAFLSHTAQGQFPDGCNQIRLRQTPWLVSSGEVGEAETGWKGDWDDTAEHEWPWGDPGSLVKEWGDGRGKRAETEPENWDGGQHSWNMTFELKGWHLCMWMCVSVLCRFVQHSIYGWTTWLV